MTYKMIEYIEITQNTKILKIADFAIKSGFNFFNRYGIFWMAPGESSCPENSEYVWQRGVGGL